MSDQASNGDAIPSPQCALGTTPHLSIQKTARDEGEERRKGDRGREETREKTAEDVKDDGREKGERNREITALFTPQEEKNVTTSTVTIKGVIHRK